MCIAGIVFKQRCFNPNHPKTPVSNREHVRYIATRCGVVRGDGLTHGLYGKLNGMQSSGDITDLHKTMKYIRDLSARKTIVYRTVISLLEADAIQKGYNKREAWEQLIQSKISMIAEKMDIPIERLEWCAATHMDKGHPHTHLLYWDKAQGVRKAWIAPETSNAIRRDLNKFVFAEEFEHLYQEKNQARSALDNSSSKVLSDSIVQMEPDEYEQLLAELQASDPDLCAGSLPYGKINDSKYDGLMIQICQLAAVVPKSGRLVYKLMPEEIKRQIDGISDQILRENVDCKREFDRYISTAIKIAEMNTSNKKVIKAAGQKAYKEAQTKIGNLVLEAVKEIKSVDRLYQQEEPREIYYRQAATSLINEIFALLSQSNEHQTARMNTGRDLSKQAKKEIALKLQGQGTDWGQ